MYFDENNYKKNEVKNKKQFEEWEKMMKLWYKNDFYKFSNLINKNLLLSLIDKNINEYYEQIYKIRVSKIPDYEFLSVHEKNKNKNEIESSLNPYKEKMKINFHEIMNIYYNHKEILCSNFIIEYISNLFFHSIIQKFEEKIDILINNNKKEIDLKVKEAAEKIYIEISKGINLDLIKK